MRGWLIRRVRSFRHAIRGLAASLATEPNMRIHLLATILVIGAGWWFQINRFEWLVVIIAIGLVGIAELLNTAIEHLADAVTLEHNPHIRLAKDTAAAAVLIAAIVAVIVGACVFVPAFYARNICLTQ